MSASVEVRTRSSRFKHEVKREMKCEVKRECKREMEALDLMLLFGEMEPGDRWICVVKWRRDGVRWRPVRWKRWICVVRWRPQDLFGEIEPAGSECKRVGSVR